MQHINFIRLALAFLVIILLYTPVMVLAQAPGSYFGRGNSEYWELGIFAGGSQYNGDLQPNKIETNAMHPSVGAFLRYSPNKRFSFRGGFTYGKISGTDETATDASQRFRNLSFESNIYEVSAIAEWNIMGFNFLNTRRDNFTPYIFAGIAVFKFNPKTEFQGEMVALQPLGTEGQGLTEYPERQPYSLTQISIPHGIGIKYQLSRRVSIGLEVSPRKTFTDYLDDVSTEHVDKDLLASRKGNIAAMLSDRSWELDTFEDFQHGEGSQRGNPDTDDWYTFFGFSITFNLASDRCTL